jgi:hypothetical protein
MLRKRSEAGATVDAGLQPGRTAVEPESSWRARLGEVIEDTFIAAEDTPIEVHWAEQKFSPVPFNTFGVGPFKATVMVRKGESIPDAVYRMWQALDELAQRIRVETGTGFLKGLEDVTTAARTPR